MDALPRTLTSAQAPLEIRKAVTAAESKAAAARVRPNKRPAAGHGGIRQPGPSKVAKKGNGLSAGLSAAQASPADAAGSDVVPTVGTGATGAPAPVEGATAPGEGGDAASDAECPSDNPPASRPVFAGVQAILRGYTIGCPAYTFDMEQLNQGVSSCTEETAALKAARQRIAQKLRETSSALRSLVDQFHSSATSASASAATEDPILEMDIEAAILASVQHDRAAADLERLTFEDLRNALVNTSGQRGKRAASAGLSLVVLAAAGRRRVS